MKLGKSTDREWIGGCQGLEGGENGNVCWYVWGFLGGDENVLKSTSGDCCIILSMLKTTGLYIFKGYICGAMNLYSK